MVKQVNGRMWFQFGKKAVPQDLATWQFFNDLVAEPTSRIDWAPASNNAR